MCALIIASQSFERHYIRPESYQRGKHQDLFGKLVL